MVHRLVFHKKCVFPEIISILNTLTLNTYSFWQLRKSTAAISKRGMGCRGLRKKYKFPETLHIPLFLLPLATSPKKSVILFALLCCLCLTNHIQCSFFKMPQQFRGLISYFKSKILGFHTFQWSRMIFQIQRTDFLQRGNNLFATAKLFHK